MLKTSVLIGILLWFVPAAIALRSDEQSLEQLVRVFEQNPSDSQAAIHLLDKLDKQGKPNREILERYFKTQQESDYFKDYNWKIVRDYVHDINTPQLKYLFAHQDKFITLYSKDDVFQKMDNVLVAHLEDYYTKNEIEYEYCLQNLKRQGYEHYDIVSDYFNIRKLRINKQGDDYFYKARKLFRYFPEDRKMIKEITAGALEIMDDVTRLKVIQLWAGKTVESTNDFDALYNYVLISEKCGFDDVARKYAGIASNVAVKMNNPLLRKKANHLTQMLR